MPSPRVLIAEPVGFSSHALNILEAAADVETRAISAAELSLALRDYDVVWVRLAHRIGADAFTEGQRCRALVTATTGLDHIDLAACQEYGVDVLSLRGETEFLNSVRATAELTLGLTLALLRRLPQAHASARSGVWDRDAFRGHELFGKVVGLVGVGRLGRLTAGYFSALGMRVTGYDPRPDFPGDLVERAETLEALLAGADVVSIHASYDGSTHHLVGAGQLALMKRNAVLVNTARGGIIDGSALVRALESGALAGAALDVVEGEPDVDEDHPLVAYAQRANNLLIVPHIGGNTHESFEKTEVFMAKKVVQWLGRAGS